MLGGNIFATQIYTHCTSNTDPCSRYTQSCTTIQGAQRIQNHVYKQWSCITKYIYSHVQNTETNTAINIIQNHVQSINVHRLLLLRDALCNSEKYTNNTKIYVYQNTDTCTTIHTDSCTTIHTDSCTNSMNVQRHHQIIPTELTTDTSARIIYVQTKHNCSHKSKTIKGDRCPWLNQSIKKTAVSWQFLHTT